MRKKYAPEPTLADHGATMAMLRERSDGSPEALAEIEEWGRRREARLPVLRRFASLLARHGIIDAEMHRITREFVIAQCFAIATVHGLDMMGYRYRDMYSGPLASLMSIDLHAVELTGEDPGRLFPTADAERAFLAEVYGKDHDDLGRMAREAVIPERERIRLFPVDPYLPARREPARAPKAQTGGIRSWLAARLARTRRRQAPVVSPVVRNKGSPEPTLADHGATMAMLRERSDGSPEALAEIEEWGRRREARLPVLRRFASLLARHGIIDAEMHRITREFVIAQCFAIATVHGLDMMGYRYRDMYSGPLASLMSIDLHAVELTGEDPGRLFPTADAERAFLAEVSGKDHDDLGRMAREAVIPERERMLLPEDGSLPPQVFLPGSGRGSAWIRQ